MSGNQWQWDASRRAWCYWDDTQQSWVYENQNNNAQYDVSGTNEEADQNNGVSTTVEEGTPEQVTEPGALRSGIRAQKKVGAHGGDIERLDPRYVRRPQGRDFYKTGKVFKVLWPEPAGNPQEGITFVTGSFGEQIYDKIRWFVVIREGHDCCTCLPIQTYNRRGLSKQGVIKSEHSVVHTIDTYPQVPNWEDPYGEMLQPIPIVATNPEEHKMNPMSRLNYAKPYTVEHNVKSFDFGYVSPDFVPTMLQNFLTVLQRPASPATAFSGGSYQ